MRRLRNLKVREVSCVEEPANALEFLVLKNKEGIMPGMNDVLADLLSKIPQDTMRAIDSAVAHFPVKVAKGANGEVESGPMDPNMAAAMRSAAKLMAPFSAHITPEMMKKLQDAIGIAPGDGQPDQVVMTADTEKAADKKKIPGFIQDKIDAKEEAEEEEEDKEDAPEKEDNVTPGKKKKVQKSADDVSPDADTDYTEGAPGEAKPDAEPTPAPEKEEPVAEVDPILKSFSKEQREVMEPILKAHRAEAEKAARELEEEVKKSAALQDTLEEKAWIEKAAAYRHMGKPEELGALLHSLHKTEPKKATEYEAVLKSANERIAKSDAFKEVGSALSANSGADSAKGRVDAYVDSVVEKSGANARSRHQIELDYYRNDPQGRKDYAELTPKLRK